MKDKFKGWMIDTTKSDIKRQFLAELTMDDLPEGEVTVAITYTSLNYKDAAALTGTSKILQVEKCIPGIDLAGTVIESTNADFKPGDNVIATGFGLGEERYGGMAEYARLPANFLTPLPAGLSLRDAMCFGTAGFTAGLSVQALVDHGLAPNADVIVTSVGGGVGSISAALIPSLGFNLHAVTRKERYDYAKLFKPKSLIARNEFIAKPRILDEMRWDAGIDTAGGQILSILLTQMKPETMVTCCGVTAGAEIKATVMPFILRGITLKGINSVQVPMQQRPAIWNLLSKHVDIFNQIKVTEIKLADTFAFAQDLINGKVRGRVVIKVKED